MNYTDWSTSYGVRHVALIPDGNRRWARQRGMKSAVGHRRGEQVIVELLDGLYASSVHTVSVWGFSTENWQRAAGEREVLMAIYASLLENEFAEIARRRGVRVVRLGRREGLPEQVLRPFDRLEAETRDKDRHVLNLALNYGGVDEVNRAFDRMRQSNQASGDVRDFLDTAGQPHPNPDLVVRTSGEHRTSGFLPIQTAYAEYVFLAEHFPDLTLEALERAAQEFASRQRRFGA